MINEYIKSVCQILKIKEPSISYDASNFNTDTMMAQCAFDGSTIFLKKIDKPNFDYAFSIAHELRHVWQIRSDFESYFSNYKPVDQCSSVEEYNLQPAEVDANAFAAIVLTDFFHLKPLWNGLPDTVITAINSRISTITRSQGL